MLLAPFDLRLAIEPGIAVVHLLSFGPVRPHKD
ncbi:hypothetical protein QF043_001658 [Pseudomonas sp. W3I7]|nr:hypothetical protein [Pseudomonas sp. W3I7]